MQTPLLADRFLSLSGGRWLDVATGDPAWLRVERLAAEPLEAHWLERCASLASLWHPLLAECLDFGTTGGDHRFEAYRLTCDLPAPPKWRRRPSDSVPVVAGFLERCGVRAGALTAVPAGSEVGSLVVPGSIASAPGHEVRNSEACESNLFGIRLVPRPPLDAVIERLQHASGSGVVLTEIAAAPRTGGRTLLRHCAREARRLGFLVLATPALRWLIARPQAEGRGWEARLAARHVVLLHDARRLRLERVLAAHILRLGSAAGRAHHVIQLVRRGPTAEIMTLEPLTDRDLFAAAVGGRDSAARTRLQSAVARSGGRPGEVMAALNRGVARRAPPGNATASRPFVVHEARIPFEYGRQSGASRPERRGVARPAEPGCGIAAATKARVDALGARGRHAAAGRLLRHVEGEHARRGQPLAAGEAALAAGALLVARGRIAEAGEALLRAEHHLAATGHVTASTITTLLLGVVCMAQAEPVSSEARLRAAAASARLTGDRAVETWALAALGDTLWWQGRYEEALATAADAMTQMADLPACPGPRTVPGRATLAVVAAVVASRASLALGEAAQAATHVEAALEHAASSGSAAARGMAQLARAERCAVLLETDGLQACVSRGLVDARQAHCRLLALELRIALVDGLVGAGRTSDARAAARMLARFARRSVPPLVRLRAQLAVALACESPEAVVLRQTAQRLGLRPLEGAHASGGPSLQRPAMLNDLIEVMRICQEHDDSRAALVQVAELLRERTRAAAIGWLIGSSPGTVINVPAGRVRFTAGQRALDCGLPIAPHAVNDGTEAAVAVRTGGISIGALQCRWTGALPIDGGRLMALLSAAAAASAGCVRALHEPAPAPAAPLIDAELLGVSAAMQQVRQAVARAADAPFSVVIYGESGSGKELVARAIHRAGVRRSRPFCALNCAALPDDLVEAELFGHARGAFTGALTERRGLFEEADGGVLFLDELGELTARGQAKLLRALQEGEIRRLGETVSRRVDVRIVAATNRALDREVEAGRFRRDLWYRLDVIRITVPPLRDRPEDVPALAEAFWRRAAERVGSRAVLADRTIAALSRYDLPGNVRELQNVLAALAVRGPRRGSIGPALLPATLAGSAAASPAVTLDEARRVFEVRFVRAALARAGGHRGRAAAELGLTRQGLAKLMGRLGVEPPVAGEAPFE